MGRALLLNASFEPLCVVSMRRAVVLVLKEKAEIVARNGAELHSERADAARAVGDPPRPLRAGAVPQPGAALAPGRVRPRRPPLPVLQPAGREHRPRRAPLPRRPARLGQRRRVVPGVQRPQGGPPPRRGRPPPRAARRASRRPTSGSWPAPARSTRPGSRTSPRSPPPRFAVASRPASAPDGGNESASARERALRRRVFASGAEKGAMWVEQWGEGCRVPRNGVKW